MPRQRSSMPARPSSNMSFSSGASFHTAHENRQSMYPGMQSRVSDAGECDSDDDSSRSSVSDYSLRPQDSASNRASSPSDNGYNPRNRSPHRNSRTHHRYEVVEEEEEGDEYYGPRVGAIIINGPIRPGARRDNRVVFRDQDHSSTSSGSYSARSRSPRSHDGSNESSRPSDESRYGEYDDEYEEQFTPRARGSIGHSMSSRYDEERARNFARQQIARENYAREQIALEDYAREQVAREEEYLRAEHRQNRRGYRY